MDDVGAFSSSLSKAGRDDAARKAEIQWQDQKR
jgi:hypothetical protein